MAKQPTECMPRRLADRKAACYSRIGRTLRKARWRNFAGSSGPPERLATRSSTRADRPQATALVCRKTVKQPLFLFFPDGCVKPGKLNISDLLFSTFLAVADRHGQNSNRLRVRFDVELRTRSVRSSQHRLASDFRWMQRPCRTNFTTMTSPCASVRRHS